MAIKFNVEPYYDDFTTATAVDGLSPQEKYHRILFRPGHAVQSRELTQLQSMLQNQVTSMGNHFFKEGSMVIPGHVSMEQKQDYVTLSSLPGIPQRSSYPLTDEGTAQYELDYAEFWKSLEGLGVEGQTTGITAQIIKGIDAEGGDPITVYVKYLKTGTGGEATFDPSEVLDVDTLGNATVQSSFTPGYGSLAFVDRGIYFIKGHFVIVQSDSLVLDKYDTTPSYDIGLIVEESIATTANDSSLNDNAAGTLNFTAPGAHRYQIKTTLTKQANNANSIDNFLLLIRVIDGTIQQKVRATEYSIIEETLARRTFDESGNYTVRPFLGSMREYSDVNTPGDDDKLVISVEPSKAYVSGYEIETLSTTNVPVRKSRNFTNPPLNSTELFQAASVPMLIGNWIDVSNASGMPDIATFDRVELYNAALDGSRNVQGQIIGHARVRSIEFKGSGVYRLNLFDIYMTANTQKFDQVRALYMPGTPPFKADVELVSGSAVLSESNRNSMVFPLPFARVKTCDSQPDGANDDFNYVYFATKYIGEEQAAAGQVDFNTLGANAGGQSEIFEPFDENEWILVCSSGNQSGDIVDLTDPDITVTVNAPNYYSVSISGLDDVNANYASASFKLIASVKRSFNHKMKKLFDGGSENVHRYVESTQSTIQSGDIPLSFADGYKLHAVYMSSDFSTSPNTADTNVTQYYDFDNGQRDNYYDICRLKIKPNTAFVPTGQLLIHYEYFTHEDNGVGGEGDFFTVDSYANIYAYNPVTGVNDIPLEYEDIPNYTSKSTGQYFELRSSIDFRPRVNDGGGAGLADFGGTGAATSLCPQPLSTFTTDVQYYLNRIDKVYIDKNGEFDVVEGVPAIDPKLPEDPKDAMVIYHLFIPGYTLSPSEVEVTLIDNKRYTMRDIGRLDKRINTLEYYTALSLLEKEAADREIIDAATQTRRLKSGFLVDSFNSHNVGNVISPEYRCSIDRDKHQLRPLFKEDNATLVYNTASQSSSPNIKVTGELITLDYTETPYAEQKQASGWINVNPFNVFEWGGTLEVSPSSDDWKDTFSRPDVIVDQEGVYDAMLGIINETDALGTVFGEWQTNWSGSTSTSTQQAFGSGSKRGYRNRVETTTTTVTTSGQSRQGIETYVTPDTITTNLGERVVEVNFAPYMRSRLVGFKATRLKPNTVVIPYFDGVEVSDYCRPELDPSNTSGTYDGFTLWDDVKDATRNQVTAGNLNWYVQHPVGPGTLTTNDAGELIGSFFVPCNSVPGYKFKTGTRAFRLESADGETYAETSYTAKGLLETKENVSISTRVPTIERREVSDSRVVSSTRSNTTASWYDPLAQSFMIDLEGGAFVTSIKVHFYSKDLNIPVTMQIREMNQGLPTSTILPFGEVTINPVNVNDSINDFPLVNPQPSHGETEFIFPSPVYLQQDVEYCFVLMSNSDKYKVWYAEIGEDDYMDGTRISKQPYNGVLFKSQNASTWSPDQNKDLMFTINRAEFDISTDGTVILDNKELSPGILIDNPFTTTNGSSLVRVEHRNHHMHGVISTQASEVLISGAVGFNGLAAGDLNTVHEIVSAEPDSYIIDVGVNATGTGIGGGTTVLATENYQMNVFFPSIQQVNLPGTNTKWSVRTSSGANLGDNSVRPYILNSSYEPAIVNEDFYVSSPKSISSFYNETQGSSFKMKGVLSSTKDNLSPFIDIDRLSVTTVANRIDNPIGDNPDPATVGAYPYIDSTGTLRASTSGYNYIANFKTELENNGSCLAKYLTKTVSLADAADGLRVFLDINRPSQTFVDLYYKSGATDVELEDSNWVLATPNEPVRFTDDDTYAESEYVIDPPGVFNSFALKIVMRSRNTSRVPTCRDLRAIALVP